MLDTQAPLRREKITHLGIRSEGDEAKITSSIQLPMREIPAEIDLLFTLFLTSFLVGCPPPNDPLFLGRSTWGQILASQMLRHFASKPRLHQLGPIHTTSSCRKIFEYYEYLILLAHQ